VLNYLSEGGENRMSITEDVLRKRYFLKDENGEVIEDWEGLCGRVAKAVSQNEEEYKDFYEVLHECLFLPNTPALTNAGKEKFSMSACFVLPVEDSMEEIFEAVRQAALIQKYGGGTGFSFSRLRPSGDMVGSTKGVASGPCSFIRVFDTATDVTKQGGTRRGANMGILRVDHPDIIEFINLKKEEGRLSNFNLSAGLTDVFMNALKEDGNIDLIFKGKVRKTARAKEIWEAIVDGAWKNGEPGVVFLDSINRDNPTPHIGQIEATNPCGEQPLLPYEACVLGSVNLSKMIKDNEIDWKNLGRTVRTGVRFLDNIIDVQRYPIPEIERMHKGNRKIGLGIMGWADMLIKLSIPYNSEEAIKLAEEVMSFITDTSVRESTKLAEERGVFPNWEGSVWQEKGIRIRNATTTTIAPTGSISIIAGCSSGIEPVFDFVTVQKRPVGEHKVIHPLYEEWLKEHGDGALPPHFVTAREIPYQWHIKMQAAFQKHTHNAVSKTINLPNNSTKEDVSKAFFLAHELGCKGITIYRDGSRKEQVISSPPEADENKKADDLPPVLDARRICIDTFEGKVYVNISLSSEKEPLEVFISTPVETRYAEIYESFGRIFSVALRNSVPVKKLLSQLEKANRKYGSVSSIPAALIRAFRMLGIDGNQIENCPDCGGVLVLEEGCIKCLTCGYTKC
jgi:ribonucleoside-diphosphate reductase alpha chain